MERTPVQEIVEAINNLAPSRKEQAEALQITHRSLTEWLRGNLPRVLRTTPPSVLRAAAQAIEKNNTDQPA